MATPTERPILIGLASTACLLVLAAIFFPTYAGGGPSIRTACISNMKHLGVGIAIYMADNEDRLPVSRSGAVPTVVGWAHRIYPYVKSEHVYKDPEEIKALASPDKERPRVSYAMNANVAARPDAILETEPNATQKVLLYEVQGSRRGRGGDLQTTLALSPAGDGAVGGLLDSIDPNIEPMARPATGPLDNSGLDPKDPPRHKGKSCFVFLDTSARAFAPNEVSAGASARKPTDASFSTGCGRPDLPGIARPCAAGAARKEHRATFSLH